MTWEVPEEGTKSCRPREDPSNGLGSHNDGQFAAVEYVRDSNVGNCFNGSFSKLKGFGFWMSVKFGWVGI